MTVADLIARVLQAIRAEFYGDDARGAREFRRDERALTKAIARYGYACAERGWDFEPHEVCTALLQLLPQITKPTHQYLPVYLERCIDRHVGQRAEQLNERAKAARAVGRIAGLTVEEAIKRTLDAAAQARPRVTTCETLATVYRDLAARSRKGRESKRQVAARQVAAAAPQLSLL